MGSRENASAPARAANSAVLLRDRAFADRSIVMMALRIRQKKDEGNRRFISFQLKMERE